MKNLFILLFVFFSLTCNKNDLLVSVVDVDGFYESIKKNNKSSFILVNIWSTYCLPCIEEFPYVVNLENRYDKKILDVIFLSTDWDENAEEAHHFLINNNVYGQHYRKIEGNDQEFINKICPNWTGALPFTGIYNKKLDLISYWEGKKDEDFFINVIDSLIKLKEEKI